MAQRVGGTEDIVKVDYDLGGNDYVAQFRAEHLGEVECSCCHLVTHTKECESVALTTQRAISKLDAELIKLKASIDAGALRVSDTDMKEKSLQDQIDKFDRDIDLADDAVDAKDVKMNTAEKALRAREETLDAKEGNLSMSLVDEDSLRLERISMVESDLYDREEANKRMHEQCIDEGLQGPDAACAYTKLLHEAYQEELETEADRLTQLTEECGTLQQEICQLIPEVHNGVLQKIERKEQKGALLINKHRTCRQLRSKYQFESTMLLKQISKIDTEAEEHQHQSEDDAVGSDEEMNSSLKILLELPEPTTELLSSFMGSDEMDEDLIALQAMMGDKRKSWPKVVMFLEGVLEWNEITIAEVERLVRGGDDGVTWQQLHNVFEHIAVWAGQKLEHKPWWRTGEWKWVEK